MFLLLCFLRRAAVLIRKVCFAPVVPLTLLLLVCRPVQVGTGFTSVSATPSHFYAPSLEAQGGTALADYIFSKDYLEFTAANKTLGPGVGFWANKP